VLSTPVSVSPDSYDTGAVSLPTSHGVTEAQTSCMSALLGPVGLVFSWCVAAPSPLPRTHFQSQEIPAVLRVSFNQILTAPSEILLGAVFSAGYFPLDVACSDSSVSSGNMVIGHPGLCSLELSPATC
jgi:hypothetical protein